MGHFNKYGDWGNWLAEEAGSFASARWARRFEEPTIAYTADGKEFVDPRRTAERISNPYSYDSFYEFREKDLSKSVSEYSDRLQGWDNDAWKRAHNAVPNKRFDQMTKAQCTKFLSAYYDRKVKCTALIHGCNASNGYPFFIFMYEEIKNEEN